MPTTPVDDLNYEQARSQLVEVVQRLEQGSASLEESLALWERGEALAQRCQTWLDGARDRLRAVSAARTDQSGNGGSGQTQAGRDEGGAEAAGDTTGNIAVGQPGAGR